MRRGQRLGLEHVQVGVRELARVQRRDEVGFDEVRAARDAASTSALVCGPDRPTYEELAHRSRRVAGGLYACGAKPGDRIAVWSANGADWAAAMRWNIEYRLYAGPAMPLREFADRGDKTSRSQKWTSQGSRHSQNKDDGCP